MKTSHFTKNIYLILIGILASIGISYAALWTAPTSTPPGNNIDVPINTSPLLQEKAGSLSVNTFVAHGDSVLKQGAFFRGALKGIDPGNPDPTLKIGGTTSAGVTNRVVASATGDIRSGKTIGSTELKNSSLQALCSDTNGQVVLCGGTGGDVLPSSPTTYATCFIADTMVTLADGSRKKIQDVQIGDTLKGDITNNTVLAFHRPELGNKKLYAFNGGTYFVTAEHPFLTTTGWKSIDPNLTAKENIGIIVTPLTVGDVLITDKGFVALTSITSKSAAASTELYNFILDGDHTYYADGYLVHNKQLCSATGGVSTCSGSLACVDQSTGKAIINGSTGSLACANSCSAGSTTLGGTCPTGMTKTCVSGAVMCQ